VAAKSKLTRIEKRKRLEALFDRGEYVRFNRDSNGKAVIDPDPATDSDVKIWVAPPSPLQREMAIREAQATRSRIMLDARGKEDSQDWLTVQNFVQGLSQDALLDYALELDESTRLQQARREVLAEKEWEDFNALRDAMRQFEEAGSPMDDPEWQPLLARDLAFGEQIEARANELRIVDRESMSLMPRGKVEEKALEKRIDQAGSTAFMGAYEEWMLYYACRDDEDHSALFFETLAELKSLPTEVQDALVNQLASFITEATEAKNSQGAESGSTLSAPPVEPETSESSTPEASSA
jgi:hypothetical protein